MSGGAEVFADGVGEITENGRKGELPDTGAFATTLRPHSLGFRLIFLARQYGRGTVVGRRIRRWWSGFVRHLGALPHARC